MMPTERVAAFAMTAFLPAWGDGTSSQSGNTAPATIPATETDSDPTPQTGTGGAGQSRPSGG